MGGYLGHILIFYDGRVRKIFFGSEILTKRDYFGFIKDVGVWEVANKNAGLLHEVARHFQDGEPSDEVRLDSP